MAAVLLLCVLAVSACAAEQPLKPAPSSRFITATPPAVAVPPKPTVRIAKAPKPRVYPEPHVLDGLTAQKVEALLGAPGFKRSDEPAEIWQYRVKTCTLDLFMYENLDSNQRSVAHFETRAPQGQTVSSKDCFVNVLKAAELPAKAS